MQEILEKFSIKSALISPKSTEEVFLIHFNFCAGGQSALRFSRLRDEKRHNYVRKIAELAVQFFITNDKVNVAGLVLAGSADFKTELGQSDLFDQRLQAKIVKVVDVSYGY